MTFKKTKCEVSETPRRHPDPEPLFATNAEARAYNWKQLAPNHYHFGLLGPDLNEFIKGAVTRKITPPAEYATLIRETKIF